jgi:hypothetical protein
MKKFFLSMLVLVSVLGSFAQTNEKFVKAMEQKLVGYDSVRSNEGLQELANTFERIAEAEKTQWLPYYYAALSNVNLGFNYAMAAGPMGGNADKVDPLADKAEKLLNKADELSKDNSEVYIVKKLIASLRMLGDVMNRYMTYGPLATEALATAKKLNPENPRVYVLEGTDLFSTPEEYGGNKAEAKLKFEEALKKYETFKPESSIHPTWGMGQAKYFLSQIK